MRALAQRWLRASLQTLGLDTVSHRGRLLPARRLRLCGAEFRDDALFLASAESEARRLVERLDLAPDGRIVDVGCGYGRLAVGLLSLEVPFGGLLGLDVSREAVAWCRRRLTPLDRRLRFEHVDVRNERYAPRGRPADPGFRLPVPDAGADVVYLFSVFSHMEAADVRLYLAEFARILRPGGRAFCTAFVEEDVPPSTVNPEGYRKRWAGPLHAVRFDRARLAAWIEEAGLRLSRFEHAVEVDGQSGLYLERPG